MLNINSLHISGKISSSVDVILLYINTLAFPLNSSRCSLRCLWRRDVGTLQHFDFTVIKHTEQQIPTCTLHVNNAWLSGQLAEANIFWCVPRTDTLTEKVRENYHAELSIRGDFCRPCRKHEDARNHIYAVITSPRINVKPLWCHKETLAPPASFFTNLTADKSRIGALKDSLTLI